jgi:hypothetical protein
VPATDAWPTPLDLMRNALAGSKIGDEEKGILMHRYRPVPAIGSGDEPQPPAPFLDGKSLLLVARWQSNVIRDDPDLKEMHGLRPR